MTKKESILNDLCEHKEDIIKIIISAVLLIVGLIVEKNSFIVSLVIFIIAYIIVGYEVIFSAIKNIIHGEIFDECFLMAIASIGAFAIKSYEEAVAVMLFYQLGEFLQDFAVDRSKNSITALMDIRPDYANVIRNGKKMKVDPSTVSINETIVILPGEKVPLDAVIIDGFSSFDTSALTGESMPREFGVNDEILSGCINKNAVITAKVTKTFGESTVSKILDMVENAQENKAKTESFIRKFAGIYTPVIVIAALLIGVLPPLFINNATFSEWIYRALSFLVISCPCALVISVPLSFFGGIGAASRKGILIKGGNYLEALASTNYAVFDKTGTLTKGVFTVQKINSEDEDKNKLLEIAAHIEAFSTHPIAKSICEAYEKKTDEKRVCNIEEIAGRGIIAEFDGIKYMVGNDRMMIENGIEFKESDEIGTIVYIAEGKNYLGNIIISDEIKKDSKSSIQLLHDLGVKKTIMLTGDAEKVADKIGKEIGIDEIYSELLPSDKVAQLKKIIETRNEKETVAYIGDGINDAPVIAASDVGIAMGSLGSDAAIEAADIVLMTDEPSRLADAIKIARRTRKIAKENIIFALTVKVLILILAAFNLTTMWIAVFADVGVAMIAVLNALRTMKNK